MLNDDQILTIYEWFLEGAAVQDIANHFDITPVHVHNIVNGKVYKSTWEQYFPHARRKEAAKK